MFFRAALAPCKRGASGKAMAERQREDAFARPIQCRKGSYALPAAPCHFRAKTVFTALDRKDKQTYSFSAGIAREHYVRGAKILRIQRLDAPYALEVPAHIKKGFRQYRAY